MLIGIFWALLAGLMLGLYALPAKYTKGFREENTWGLFFMLTMFVVPILATMVIMKGVGNIYGNPEVRAILPQLSWMRDHRKLRAFELADHMSLCPSVSLRLPRSSTV